MKKNLLTGFLMIGFLAIWSAVSINAQTNLAGKYHNVETIADEELAKKNEDKIDWRLDVNSNNTVVLTSVAGKTKEIRAGSWSWNKAEKSLSVNFPARKKSQVGFTYIFSIDGKNLMLVKMLTDEGEGETSGQRIFKKL